MKIPDRPVGEAVWGTVPLTGPVIACYLLGGSALFMPQLLEDMRHSHGYQWQQGRRKNEHTQRDRSAKSPLEANETHEFRCPWYGPVGIGTLVNWVYCQTECHSVRFSFLQILTTLSSGSFNPRVADEQTGARER